MRKRIRLDRYDEAALRLVENQETATPAIIDVFRGLQSESDKCYHTLYYRIRNLENVGYVALDKQKDRVFVKITEAGRAALRECAVGHEAAHAEGV